MKARLSLCFLSLCGLLLCCGVASAQSTASQSSNAGSDKMPWQMPTTPVTDLHHNQVEFLAPVQVEVAAGRPAAFDIHLRVADGLHINSHAPHDANLIATRILVADEGGLSTTAIDFPPGTETSLAFAPKAKMSVYSGELTLKAHIRAAAGHHLWQAVMRYQACDLNACMPPSKLPIAVDVIAK